MNPEVEAQALREQLQVQAAQLAQMENEARALEQQQASLHQQLLQVQQQGQALQQQLELAGQSDVQQAEAIVAQLGQLQAQHGQIQAQGQAVVHQRQQLAQAMHEAQKKQHEMQAHQLQSAHASQSARNSATILCCMCGVPITPNAANMCVSCIRTQADVTEGISREGFLFQCRHCMRYLGARWIACELESRELLAVCLKKVQGLGKDVRLVDAGFVWTEPHSKRIKVKLTIQGEVLNGTILQQTVVVEFEVRNQQCPDCQKSFTPHEGWKAVVQLRQKVTHKRTFLYLEQLMLKHKAHADAMRVKEVGDGLDFFFANRSHAVKFLDFIQGVAPSRSKQSKKLISQDFSSNVANFKYSMSVEIAPVCKDDLVCLPLKLARQLGSISPLVLVNRVSSMVHFIDPLTLNTAEINATQYWANEFRSLADKGQLIEFCVLDIEPLGPTKGRNVLAEATVARVSDFGRNDKMFTTVTHLGALLRPGDYALGYDLLNANFNDDLSPLKGKELPDVILTRKKFMVPRRRKRRVFKLQRMEIEEMEKAKGRGKKDDGKDGNEFEEFVRDLEEDPEMRGKINMFKKGPEDEAMSEASSAGLKEEDPTFPEVKLEELMENLNIGHDDAQPQQQPMGPPMGPPQ